jgi:hypothetical protein
VAISYVGALEDATAGASPKTVAVNIGTRTNGLLVVAVCFYDNAMSTPAVTYAGTAMSLASEYPATNGVYHVALYYLANPTNGNNNLVLTWTGSNLSMYVLASWYDGVAQTSPLDQVVTGTGATDPSLNITPTENNELIVSHYFSASNDELAVGSGETKIDGYDWGGDVTGGSYAIQTTAGTQTVDWSGADNTWYMVVASFKQAAAGGAISGSTAGTSSASGALTGAGALAGTATAVGSPVATLIGAGALAGESAGLSTCSGNLEGLAEAAGTAAGIGAASGVLAGEGALAGSSAGQATASGTLTPPSGDGAMIGASAGTSSASGSLAGSGALAGAGAGASTVLAILMMFGYITGATAGVSSAGGILTGYGELSGYSDGVSIADGTLGGAGVLAGNAVGFSVASGVLLGYVIVDTPRNRIFITPARSGLTALGAVERVTTPVRGTSYSLGASNRVFTPAAADRTK